VLAPAQLTPNMIKRPLLAAENVHGGVIGILLELNDVSPNTVEIIYIICEHHPCAVGRRGMGRVLLGPGDCWVSYSSVILEYTIC